MSKMIENKEKLSEQEDAMNEIVDMLKGVTCKALAISESEYKRLSNKLGGWEEWNVLMSRLSFHYFRTPSYCIIYVADLCNSFEEYFNNYWVTTKSKAKQETESKLEKLKIDQVEDVKQELENMLKDVKSDKCSIKEHIYEVMVNKLGGWDEWNLLMRRFGFKYILSWGTCTIATPNQECTFEEYFKKSKGKVEIESKPESTFADELRALTKLEEEKVKEAFKENLKKVCVKPDSLLKGYVIVTNGSTTEKIKKDVAKQIADELGLIFEDGVVRGQFIFKWIN